MMHGYCRLRILLGVIALSGCDDRQQALEPFVATAAASVLPESAPAAVASNDATLNTASLTLPFYGTVSSSTTGFRVAQTGTGMAGMFEITNASNLATALRAVTSGAGAAVHGRSTGTGNGGYFQVNNASSNSAAVYGWTNGSFYSEGVEGHSATSGVGVRGTNGGGGHAGWFETHSTTGTSSTVLVRARGQGSGVHVVHFGSGPAFSADVSTAVPNLVLLEASGVPQVRIDRNGTGFFNGGTQTGGADVAEAFEVEGAVSAYRPGDVLVISTRNDQRVARSNDAYSTRVIGVYATQPGVLLTERGIDDSLDDMIPVGVVGIIPTRVTAENGAIKRGDILVTARTAGHAMRATPVEVNGIKLYPSGSILGKALQNFAGPGTGMIKVLVNVK